MNQNTTEKIFYPGAVIEIVFNLDSLAPRSFPSIIYEANHLSKTVTVAQPSGVKLHTGIKYDQLHITTLARKDGGGKTRFGIRCDISSIDNSYRMSNGESASAVILLHKNSIIETNIRSGYRLALNQFYDAACKILYEGTDFFSGKHLKIIDLSTSGAGIIILKKTGNEKNPLLAMGKGYKGKIGLMLKKPGSESSDPVLISSCFEVARLQSNYTEKSAFYGIRFYRLNSESEDLISKFIHEAQLFEIHKATHN